MDFTEEAESISFFGDLNGEDDDSAKKPLGLFLTGVKAFNIYRSILIFNSKIK